MVLSRVCIRVSGQAGDAGMRRTVNNDTKIAWRKERSELYERNFGKEILRELAILISFPFLPKAAACDLSPGGTKQHVATVSYEMDLGRYVCGKF